MDTVTLQPKELQLGSQTYNIDPAHTTVDFVVRHLMITKVRGRFDALTGSIEVPTGSDVPTAVNVVIDASSIDTREGQRDAHLRSADFFDVERFPQLRFASTRIEGDADAFKIYGTLTLHGVSREIVLDATFEGRVNDPWGNKRLGYAAHGQISRKDFGLAWNQALETGGVVVGDDVRIEINAETIAQE